MSCGGRDIRGLGGNTLPPHKRGDTYSLTCVYKKNGYPESLQGFSIQSQMRDGRDELLTELVATVPDQNTDKGIFYLTPTNEDTSDWDLGTYYIDIEFIKEDIVNSTATMKQVIVKDITK